MEHSLTASMNDQFFTFSIAKNLRWERMMGHATTSTMNDQFFIFSIAKNLRLRTDYGSCNNKHDVVKSVGP